MLWCILSLLAITMRKWTLRLMFLVAAISTTSAACVSAEWHQFRDMCYWRSNFSLQWNDARTVCPGVFPGSDMVSIHDLELDAFIGEELMDGRRAWIGLRRPTSSASWQWIDGSVYDYHNWYDDDPDCSGDCCAAINYVNDGDWIAYTCNHYFFFICQMDAS